MSIPLPHQAPALFYRAFVKDTVRVYRILPARSRFSFWTILSLQIVTGVLETGTLLVISLFALSVASPETVSQNFLVSHLLANYPFLRDIFGTPRRLVALTATIMILAVILKSAFVVLESRLTALFAERASLHICRETVASYINRPFLWHLAPASQETVVKILNRHYLASFLINLEHLYGNAITCLILFVSLAVLEPTLTLIVVSAFGLASFSLYALIRRRLDRSGQAAQEAQVAENKTLMALARGLREITIYRRQKITMDLFTGSLTRALKPRAFLNFAPYLPSAILEVVGFVTIGALVIAMLASHMTMESVISAASLLMLTAWRILPAVNRCLSYSVQIRGYRSNALVALELQELFSLSPSPPPPPPDPLFRLQRALELIDVSFRYPQAATDSLDAIRLSIPLGQKVAFIGPSGSGKSTLALLLAGLAPPTSGEFLVDGEPLGPARREAYFAALGFVPQNPLILDGDIRSNIVLGRPLDEERLSASIKAAGIDFLEGLPLGLATPLSAGRPTLSGGQIQRLAIARAFYGEARVLIFDEATSSLDQASERVILKSLSALPAGTTVILIAHRLTTVATCDTIYWLERGAIRAQGPPAEIIPRYEAETPRAVARA
ncbi:MAG: ABC transporter ATP-binding protein/permease [Deltaproteobacteria bacterium]|nr:ABC transporter ATP-binding protein/permease [Deltaproteobacteria bacterium]